MRKNIIAYSFLTRSNVNADLLLTHVTYSIPDVEDVVSDNEERLSSQHEVINLRANYI
jgi:hypothetical protein